MNQFLNKNLKLLSLGAESAGRFAFYEKGNFFISDNFGDLIEDRNLDEFKTQVKKYIKIHKPDVVLTDLHPLYNSTIFGEELSKKLKIPHIKVQHHIAHIFSAVGDRIILDTKYLIPDTFFGIAADGTGYGLDGNIWGGEIFSIKYQVSSIKYNKLNKNLEINRIGSLEEQTMIGGDLAVREPARMLIAIMAGIKNYELGIRNKNTKNIKTKDSIYIYVKRFYTRNEFELLYNQLEQNFNCQKTTSAGRVLDAVSVLLGFAENERNYKHEATRKLEENSGVPYRNYELRIRNYESRLILDTAYLFEYLMKNIYKDKKRLAATAQEYIVKGFYEMVVRDHDSKFMIQNSCFAAGGMANNKIISSYLENQGVYLSKKIPRGDEGIAVGQIVYYLLNSVQ